MVSVVSATVIVAGTIDAVPSKLVPPIVRAVSNAVAVEALPVKAPVKVVAVTALSFSNTESIVTPAAAVVSAIVSVVTF